MLVEGVVRTLGALRAKRRRACSSSAPQDPVRTDPDLNPNQDSVRPDRAGERRPLQEGRDRANSKEGRERRQVVRQTGRGPQHAPRLLQVSRWRATSGAVWLPTRDQ
eukprot:scaffold1310_cov36-Phaeocystis_antarctica.AAC.1